MSNKFFGNIKKNFGFGCMRLPMNGEQVDYEETCKMIDTFMEMALIILIQPMVILMERVK